jgi:L-cysteine desulfidase
MALCDGRFYQACLDLLREELVPAYGCTEPIAIAYAAASARGVLGCLPDRMVVRCSGNIIKNAKSVVVPNTGNLKGIEASAIAGAVAGNAGKGMQVLMDVTGEDIPRISNLMRNGLCRVERMESQANLHIIVSCAAGEDSATVEIIHSHTNISRIIKNGKILFEKAYDDRDFNAPLSDRSFLTIEGIYRFALSVKIDDVKALLDEQARFNLAIAEEGLARKYGVNIGKLLLECYSDHVFTKIRAYAAAGSDARMSGCPLPAITNSGSGNQGMTASLPVLIYAREKGFRQENTYRGLLLSNLITIHQKSGLGRLSAYCGAVCAACGSGAGITFLEGGTIDQIDMTITNTLANISGIVCDGAKASCAAKIASCIDAAIIAHLLAMRNKSFESGSGIVKETIENTIAAACRLGREGMRETDVEILKIMMNE